MLVILSSLSVTGQTSNVTPATPAVVPQPQVQMSETAPCCLLSHVEWINLIPINMSSLSVTCQTSNVIT